MGTLKRTVFRLTACLVYLAVQSSSQSLRSPEGPQDVVEHSKPSDGLSTTASRVLQAGSTKLKTCIITADFWGMLQSESGRGVRAVLKGGGGTATATHLLANTLKEHDFVDVTFLGVTKEIGVCEQAQKVVTAAHCLEDAAIPALECCANCCAHMAQKACCQCRRVGLDRCTRHRD